MASKMKKSVTAAPDPVLDLQKAHEIADAMLESAIEYVVLSELKAAFRDQTGGNIKISPSSPSEDIGRAVMMLMSKNRCTDVYREIVEIECDISESDVFSESAQNFLDGKISNFGECLRRGNERDCLMYMAIICEMIVRFSTSKANPLTTRIIHKAKEVMRRYAENNDFYAQVDSYSKLLLSGYYANPRDE